MISHPIHHFHQPTTAYSPACTALYNMGHNISAFGSTSGYSITGTSTPLLTKRFIHVSHASEICRILESLFIDRVGRFWVVAKICETFTCLSRQWRQRRFLEHEYIVNSSRDGRPDRGQAGRDEDLSSHYCKVQSSRSFDISPGHDLTSYLSSKAQKMTRIFQ